MRRWRGGYLAIASVASSGVLIAVSRAIARPKSFLEWDDYIFGLSLHMFAPQGGVPQAPFFPVFVFLGRLFRSFLPTDAAALTALSAVCSFAGAAGVGLVANELLRDRRIALTSSWLFAFFPAVWFWCGSPETDPAGFAFAILVTWLFLRARSSSRFLFGAFLALGIAAGVRPQALLIALPAAVLALRRRPAAESLKAAGLGAASTAVFAIAPVLVAAGGIRPVLGPAARQWHAQLHVIAPIARGAGASFLFHRWAIDLWNGRKLAVLVLCVSLAGAGLLIRRRQALILVVLALSFLPYAVLAVLFLDPTFSGRYALPLLPIFAVLSAVAVVAIERMTVPGKIPAVLALAVAGLAVPLWPAIRLLHRRVSPPESAAAAIRAGSGLRSPVLVYAPELEVQAKLIIPKAVAVTEKALEASPDLLHRGLPAWRYGLDSLEGGEAAYWPRLGPFFTVGRGRYLAVPYGRLDPGAPQLSEGWYSGETEYRADGRPVPFWWMGRRGTIVLPPSSGQREIEMDLGFPIGELPGLPVVRVREGDTLLDRFRAESALVSRSMSIDGGVFPPGRPVSISMETSETFVPARSGRGGDRRELGLRLFRVRLRAPRGTDKGEPSTLKTEPGPADKPV